MGLSLSAQTAYFLWSLVLGAALAALYDVLRAVRMMLRSGRIRVAVGDILFSVVCGIITALFALPFNKGDVRAFILFGEAVGFLTYRLTLGAVMGKVYAFLTRIFRGFVQKIRNFLEKIFNFLLKAMARLVYNVSVVIDKSLQKALKKHSRRAARRRRGRRRRPRKERYHEQKNDQKTGRRRNSDRSHRRAE